MILQKIQLEWLQMFRLLVVSALLLLIAASWAQDEQLQVIERIKPIGRVHVESEPAQLAPTIAAKPPEPSKGKAIYEQYCSICHRAGLAGAPRFRNLTDWKSRLSIKTMKELVTSAILGKNAMPPKGTCMTCDNNAIEQAIDYMLPAHD